MKFQDLETGEEVEVGYCFAFRIAPVPEGEEEVYRKAQLRWLELWQPWPGDLPQ